MNWLWILALIIVVVTAITCWNMWLEYKKATATRSIFSQRLQEITEEMENDL